jgi:NADH-quinone oxidoreductase subunit G
MKYFTPASGMQPGGEGRLLGVTIDHIFGTELMSSQSPGVKERTPSNYVVVSADDALTLHLKDGQIVEVVVDGTTLQLPLEVDARMVRGVAGIPIGIEGVAFVQLPAWCHIKSL